MNAVDTNVLIYMHDDREPLKQQRANEFVNGLSEGVLLWQVACEYVAAARKLTPRGYTPQQAQQDIADLRKVWMSYLPTWEVFSRSAELVNRFQLSIWDSLLVAASLEAGVTTLYTEDFGGCPVIDGLMIVNPFAASK